MQSNGERFIIDNQNMSREIFLQHMGRYLFASSYVSGKVVLDAACGSRYGSEMLSQKAEKVVGVDISSEVWANKCEVGNVIPQKAVLFGWDW